MIIGICGEKGSGKSTVLAEGLRDNHGFVILSFAEPLYRMMSALLSYQMGREVDARTFLKESENPYLAGRTIRWGLQTLGTEWGRKQIDPDFWTKVWLNAALDRLPNASIVADDLRHFNEEEVIREMGGKIVRVVRSNLANKPDQHESETEWTSITPDIIIINDGTKAEALEKLVRELGL